MSNLPNHALVFGASGVAGWGLVDEMLRNYPKEGTFSRATAVVNRPLNFEDTHWPAPHSSRPQLELISGVNLLNGTVEEFAASLKDKIKDISSVTHAYYFAYKQDNDQAREVAINVGMLSRVTGAVNILCPTLKFFVFPSGTKGYGIQLPASQRPFQAPFTEDMRLPPSLSSENWYALFQEHLTTASANRSWTWCEVRPDAIIGFVPNGSTFNLAAHWATYLSAYLLLEGKGAKLPYPGSTAGFEAKFNDASASIVGRLSIYASLHPETCGGGRLFNIADQERPSSMAERWPLICEHFGLVGVPSVDEGRGALLPGEYLQANKDVLEKKGFKGVDVWKGDFLDTYGFYCNFDRQLSLAKIREIGFLEERDPHRSWVESFERFKTAGMIPGTK
ncbi:hypothetical protein VTL71DRAFT_6727 [Oculimacula yallundae]|uniref:PRISE-like Rossmann-fold domain-containing protein n=1 Tax=Oculimacula yallundae TaxID=86028 RepID=A0ABR4BZB6_9HELO